MEGIDGSVLAALIALAGTLIVLIWDVQRRKTESIDSTMLLAFDLLSGRTQRRSAGLSLLEGMSSTIGGRRDTWKQPTIAALTSSAVYLLRQSDSGARPDEIRNLVRIVDLLVRLEADDDTVKEVEQSIATGGGLDLEPELRDRLIARLKSARPS